MATDTHQDHQAVRSARPNAHQLLRGRSRELIFDWITAALGALRGHQRQVGYTLALMRAVIIGAGRGSRLQHHTSEIPKTLVEVMGRPMLTWILDSLTEAGVARTDVLFISGYAEEAVRKRYPELQFVRNEDWPNNNILASLLCARSELKDGFLASYADIVYESAVVRQILDNPHDLVLGCDTHWRRRYASRTQHPESDAEKLRAQGARVTELGRRIPSEQADGEFIGVMKASAEGAREFISAFDEAQSRYASQVYREGRPFERAYLIDLLEQMLERGTEMHRENTAGGYMEIDTPEDLALAEQWWRTRPNA